MIVYGSSLSPFVRKVLACCGEKGLEVEVRPVGPGDKDPDFREASPFGRIPGFQDGDYRLADSSAIVHYLDSKYPERPLIPAEPEARGKTIWFEEFADTILVSCGANIFFNLIVAPRFLGMPGDEEAARNAEINDLPPILDYLEKVAPGDGGYLVGETLTLADVAVASPFANFRHTNTRVDPDRYPRTIAYVDRILARPSLAPWVEREAAFLAKEPA
ncbi:MAG: glutathione S-transferase family protein [Sphingomicrobium sp.]